MADQEPGCGASHEASREATPGLAGPLPLTSVVAGAAISRSGQGRDEGGREGEAEAEGRDGVKMEDLVGERPSVRALFSQGANFNKTMSTDLVI